MIHESETVIPISVANFENLTYHKVGQKYQIFGINFAIVGNTVTGTYSVVANNKLPVGALWWKQYSCPTSASAVGSILDAHYSLGQEWDATLPYLLPNSLFLLLVGPTAPPFLFSAAMKYWYSTVKTNGYQSTFWEKRDLKVAAASKGRLIDRNGMTS